MHCRLIAHILTRKYRINTSTSLRTIDAVSGGLSNVGCLSFDTLFSICYYSTMIEFIDFLFHAEIHLREFMTNYGAWIYVLLFVIVFCETGLVITPFLPGDSLLFATGVLAGASLIQIEIIVPLLIAAAILGDAVNYGIGRWTGPRVFQSESNFFLRKQYLYKAQAFYEKHGGRAIILARFVPIARTFAPFVAGVGAMQFGRFFAYNVIGGVVWVSLFCGAGYLFGAIPVVQENMKLVIMGIIVISVVPIAWEYYKARRTPENRDASA